MNNTFRPRFVHHFSVVAVSLLFAAFTGSQTASAETLMVGPDTAYPTLALAARAAQPGDTVKIAPGTYYQCAIWQTDDLTIEGAGPGKTILTDKICQGKAIFVIHADNVTVRNLTFQRARANDGNGAGIRAEGLNLMVENSKFLNNQSGILAGDKPGSHILIRNSEFVRNGSCIHHGGCAHAVYVGHIAQLTIDHSQFFETLKGHHIKSRAKRTIVTDNHIEDGPNGTASYEVDIPNGGSVIMTGNILEKGPKNENHKAAIIIGEEGVSQPTKELIFRNNAFNNDGPSPFYFLWRTAFVSNRTNTPATLEDNFIKGNNVTPLSGPGTVN